MIQTSQERVFQAERPLSTLGIFMFEKHEEGQLDGKELTRGREVGN